MPRRIQADSLKSMCIDSICKNMESFWYQNYWKDIYSSPERVMSENGPFEYLPGYLLDEITQKLEMMSDRIKDSIITSLITSTLVELRLGGYIIRPLVFDLISLRCKETLNKLTLSTCIFENQVAMKAIKSLLKLKDLHFYRTNINDEVLAVVGSHCAELRKLSVNDCRNITDKGMEYLFVDGSSEDGANSYGKCKLLVSLYIDNTNISDYGIETVLRNAPKLQKLDHERALYVLGRMHQNDIEANSPLVQYSLRTLHAEYLATNLYPNESFARLLSIATRVCPHVTAVILRLERKIKEKDVLRPLCQLENLRSLDVTCFAGEQPDFFFSEVVPVLSVSGQSITRLHMVSFLQADVGIVGVCCPLLEDFHFNIYANYGGEDIREEILIPPVTNRKSFTFLKDLSVSVTGSNRELREYSEIKPSQWKKMLSSRHLESLKIIGSSSLTDSILSEVLKAGQQFLNLRILELFECPNITAGFVQSFLHLPNPLELIVIWNCDKITISDIGSLKSLCMVNGYDVDIDFWHKDLDDS